MTRSPLSSPFSLRLSLILSACLITLTFTPKEGVSEPTPQANTPQPRAPQLRKTQRAQGSPSLTLTQLREGFKVVGLIISEELASEALPAAREALRVAHSSANDNTNADPFALDEALLSLADALKLEAGRCSGELDRLRRLMAWLRHLSSAPK